MKNLFKKIFKSKIKNRNYFNMWEYNSWGHRIDWLNFDDRKIEGHIQLTMKVGDEVRSKMESGKIGRYEILDIEFMPDPLDQFFAKVKEIGYFSEISESDKENIKKASCNFKEDGLKLLV